MKRWIAGVITIAALGARLSAHPVATTTVSVAIDGSERYVATITADTAPLIAKLEAWSTDALPGTRTASREAQRLQIDALANVLVAHVDLEFDGVRATPRPQPAEIADTGQAVIRLVGAAPQGARTMTWASSLVFGSYPVALHAADGRENVLWLQGADRSEAFAMAGSSRTRAIARGAWLGYTHILPNGIDHILFVIGLFLLSTRARQLFAQVTAFTVAHSITLGLSLYGIFSLPAHIVEPLIALSVAYVGVENLMTSKLQPWRLVVVFCFGLLHGLGFAAALAGLHLSRPEMLSTLVSFNVGVEGGQLSVIAIAALIVYVATRARTEWRHPITVMASAAIGVTGLIWTVQRIL